MTYKPFPVLRFGGLNLTSDPEEVGAEAAVDLLNVRFDTQGRVRTRGGYTTLVTAGASIQSLVAGLAGDGPIVYDGTNTIGLSDTGTTIAAINRPFVASTPHGTTSANRIYFSSTGGTASFYWNGATFTSWTPTVDGTPASAAPKAFAMGVTPNDNRLVVGNIIAAPAGGAANVHGLYFSEAGDPETWLTSNFLALDPGDGQTITAIQTYRNQMFVFKYRKFFVFYGTAVDGEGNPIFNYRAVDTGKGTTSAALACVTPFGVAFVADDGVYLTSGDAPTKISGAVEALWTGDFNDMTTLTEPTGFVQLKYFNGCLHLSVTISGGERDYVYDMETQAWSVYSFNTFPGAAAIATDRLYFADGQPIYVHRPDDTYTTDSGTAIASSYRSGLYELGAPGAEAFTRWTRVWGCGSPIVGVLTDHGTSDSRAAAVTLGSYPAVTQGFHQQSYSGRLVAHQLSATSGRWSVSRLIHDVAHVRP